VAALIHYGVREAINSKWSTDVRLGAHSGLKSDITALPKSTVNGFMHRSKQQNYSITSSAVASNVGGTVNPNDCAVLRLMTNWNFVGCCTGSSAGFAPLRMRST